MDLIGEHRNAASWGEETEDRGGGYGLGHVEKVAHRLILLQSLPIYNTTTDFLKIIIIMVSHLVEENYLTAFKS